MLKDEDIAKITIDLREKRIYVYDKDAYLIEVRPWLKGPKANYYPFAKSSPWGHVIVGFWRSLVNQINAGSR